MRLLLLKRFFALLILSFLVLACKKGLKHGEINPDSEDILLFEVSGLNVYERTQNQIYLYWDIIPKSGANVGDEVPRYFRIAYQEGADAPENCAMGNIIYEDEIVVLSQRAYAKYRIAYLKPGTQYSIRVCPSEGKDTNIIGQGSIVTTNTMDGEPVTLGSYCTTIRKDSFVSERDPGISFVCLQNDNTWKEVGYEIDLYPDPSPGAAFYHYPYLFTNDSGDIFIGFERTIVRGMVNSEEQLLVKYFDKSSGRWKFIVEKPINVDENGKLVNNYSQHGAAFTEFNNNIYVAWTTWGTNGYISRLEGTNWTHSEIVGHERFFIRFPKFQKLNNKLYVYYASHQPTVLEVNSSGHSVHSTIPVNLSNEYTLGSSLAYFNNNLVISYMSSSYPQTSNWFTQLEEMKIAFHDGNSWSVEGGTTQDTPGRDGLNPFLFVINNELYVLYPDYTTVGVPNLTEERGFRFRVKKRNAGGTWDQVGAESQVILNTLRYDYLLDDDKVLFSVVDNDRIPTNGARKNFVLMWQNGTFTKLGDDLSEIRTSVLRLGNIIKNQQ